MSATCESCWFGVNWVYFLAIPGGRLRICRPCLDDYAAQMQSAGHTLLHCPDCGAIGVPTALDPASYRCAACLTAAAAFIPAPDLVWVTTGKDQNGDTSPCGYIGPDGAHYILARTGLRRPLGADGTLYERIELPPGEQVPCYHTDHYLDPPGRPHQCCHGWAAAGWRNPHSMEFICDGCWAAVGGGSESA